MELELELELGLGLGLGLRDYLLILGAILIVGLLADGIRRTLKHKREGLKLDLMAAPPESPERSDVSKPRFVRKTMPEDLEPKIEADPLFDSSDVSQLNLWAGEIKAEAMKAADTDTLNGEFTKDTLTDSLFEEFEPRDSGESINAVSTPPGMHGTDRLDPTWIIDTSGPSEYSDSAEISLELEDNKTDAKRENFEARLPSELGKHIYNEDMQVLSEGHMPAAIPNEIESGFLGSALETIFGHFGKNYANSSGQKATSRSTDLDHEAIDEPFISETQDNASNDLSMLDMVLVRIQSSRVGRLEGVNLHKACLRAGLRRSKLKIYQRFPLDEADHPLFSLVNGIEPGVFEDDAKSIDTPVLFLFTELPKQSDPVFAVNELISGARSIARDIGCDVFDQGGTPISKDWIDLVRAQASHQNLIRS